MSDHTYEHDALAWAEHQAMLLRRLASGERLNEPVDWPNVIEEVQDVGLSELRAFRSLLRQAMVHLLKLHASPGNASANHWRAEIIGFLADARDTFSPSMRRRINMADLYRVAVKQARAGLEDVPSLAVLPSSCPFMLDELLAEDTDPAALAKRLAA